MENKLKDIERITKFSNAPGISGFEDVVVELVNEEVKSFANCERDSLNNVYIQTGEKDNSKPTVMLDAHSDEVGFMVKDIRPNGLIDFINIGGWVTTNIPAHKVKILNKNGEYISGIIANKPPHFLSAEERNKPLEVSQLGIDIGAKSMEEVVEDYGIKIAAPVIPDVECTYDEKHDRIVGKAFDNRLGCAAVVSTIEELIDEDLNVNLIGAIASQEEVGVRGAILTSRRVKPDIAIAFEGCPADDTVVEPYKSQTALDKGPMLRHIDARMITNPRFQRFSLDLAEKLNIPVQEAVRSAGGTDGASIHIAELGIPCIVVGIPVRYAHTHYGISSYSDYRNAINLVKEIIKRLDFDLIKSF